MPRVQTFNHQGKPQIQVHSTSNSAPGIGTFISPPPPTGQKDLRARDFRNRNSREEGIFGRVFAKLTCFEFDF